MDADFSHDPKEIEQFLITLDKYDLVIGSRYINGVRVINWPIRRLLLSYFANLYTRVITGMPVKDGTGGYKCIRRKVLEAISLDEIHSNGYSFQIEVNYKAWKKKFKIIEIPITFVDRVQGTSKMSKKIVREAIFMVWKLRFKSILGSLN
jgi:dolichol-phosphate mannosyltransferase